MLNEIILLLIGAILGAFLSYYTPKVIVFINNYRLEKNKGNRVKLLEDNSKVYNWLLNYYNKNDNQDVLYNCKIGNTEVKIPFISKPEWLFKIDLDKIDNIFEYSKSKENNFPINYKEIKKRRDIGHELFNNPALYLDWIEYQENQVVFHVKECEYFQLVSNIIALEEETFSAVTSSNKHNVPIRDKYFNNIDSISKLKLKPFGFGCAVSLIFKTENSYDILLNTRSIETATFGGSKGVLPNFGLEPIASRMNANFTDNGLIKKYRNLTGIFYYNFIKEFLEELYNLEDMINIPGKRKANPFWFYEHPFAKNIIDSITNKYIKLVFLGFGYDALNGNSVAAFLGLIDNVDLASEIKESFELCWETKNDSGRIADFEYIDINSPYLEEWLLKNKYHTGAAFSISRSLSYLNHR